MLSARDSSSLERLYLDFITSLAETPASQAIAPGSGAHAAMYRDTAPAPPAKYPGDVNGHGAVNGNSRTDEIIEPPSAPERSA